MKVSVIVVSLERAAALTRCILGLTQLDHRFFELVVVCDRLSADMLRRRPDAARIKLEVFDRPNISAARNRGIARASGEVLAFIDDDAVPEPTWLDRLVAPFSDPEVTATGGFVRGRNGVSHQWRASSTDSSGWPVTRAYPSALPAGHVWRTEGTNMAFRADALRSVDGFDEAFAFYLDETDVNLRLPGVTVIVPDAEVHHGFEESARRRSDRVPRTLYEIGASSVFFWQKHRNESIRDNFDELFRRERRRLLAHQVAGRLEPRDVRYLLEGLEAGARDGAGRRPTYSPLVRRSGEAFCRFSDTPAGPKSVVTGPWHRRKHLESLANRAAELGQRPTLVLFAPDPRPLQVRFRRPGIWSHIGGQFGRGIRDEPLLQWATRTGRVRAECARIAAIRGLPCDTCA